MNTSSLDREILAACRFASRDIRYFTHRMTYPRHEKTVLAAMKALQRAGLVENFDRLGCTLVMVKTEAERQAESERARADALALENKLMRQLLQGKAIA